MKQDETQKCKHGGHVYTQHGCLETQTTHKKEGFIQLSPCRYLLIEQVPHSDLDPVENMSHVSRDICFSLCESTEPKTIISEQNSDYIKSRISAHRNILSQYTISMNQVKRIIETLGGDAMAFIECILERLIWCEIKTIHLKNKNQTKDEFDLLTDSLGAGMMYVDETIKIEDFSKKFTINMKIIREPESWDKYYKLYDSIYTKMELIYNELNDIYLSESMSLIDEPQF